MQWCVCVCFKSGLCKFYDAVYSGLFRSAVPNGCNVTQSTICSFMQLNLTLLLVFHPEKLNNIHLCTRGVHWARLSAKYVCLLWIINKRHILPLYLYNACKIFYEFLNDSDFRAIANNTQKVAADKSNIEASW